MNQERRLFDELRAALSLKPKSSAVKKTEKRRRTKGAETKEIRAWVMARAGGRCEMCRTRTPTDMHHAFGRVRVRQATNNCLALCRDCHHQLTKNLPDAESAWLTVGDIFDRLDLFVEAAKAKGNAEYAKAKALAVREKIGARLRANASGAEVAS